MTLASHVWSPRAPTLGPAAPAHGPPTTRCSEIPAQWGAPRPCTHPPCAPHSKGTVHPGLCPSAKGTPCTPGFALLRSGELRRVPTFGLFCETKARGARCLPCVNFPRHNEPSANPRRPLSRWRAQVFPPRSLTHVVPPTPAAVFSSQTPRAHDRARFAFQDTAPQSTSPPSRPRVSPLSRPVLPAAPVAPRHL